MKPLMIVSLVLVLFLMAACTTPPVAPAAQPTDTAMPATAVVPTEAATEAPAETATSAPVTATVSAGTAAAWEPLDAEACAALAQDMATALGVEVTQSEAPLTDPSTGESGTGCQATATGTGEQFTSPDAVVTSLADMLEGQGWQQDQMLAAGGPTGTGEGFRKDNQMCMAAAQWSPDDSANCPADQPIAACELTPAQQLYTVTLTCGQQVAQASATPAGSAGLANPASENCVAQGGTVTIEERGDGGQYGVCLFEDNLQCEEWAMLRGDCPVGGIKVTGYVTPAAQYCAITGGTYTVTSESGAENEQGTCTFKDGSECDVWAYYSGQCAPSSYPRCLQWLLVSRVALESSNARDTKRCSRILFRYPLASFRSAVPLFGATPVAALQLRANRACRTPRPTNRRSPKVGAPTLSCPLRFPSQC
ncbi:MAG: DUF333 domain-containing protein [Caldilineales bacterium]